MPSFPRFAFQSILGLLHALVYFVYSAICFVILIGIAFCSWHGFFPITLGYSSNLANLQRRLWFIPIGTFIQEVFIPIFSSVGTMTSDDVMQAPLPVLLEYVYSTFGTDHYSLGGGLSASHIARQLAQPIDDQGEGYLRLGKSITDLRYVEDGVEVVIGEEEILVDKVIIATQASSARTLLRMLLPTARKGELRRVNGMLEGLDNVRYRVSHRLIYSLNSRKPSSSHTEMPRFSLIRSMSGPSILSPRSPKWIKSLTTYSRLHCLPPVRLPLLKFPRSTHH